MKRQVTILVSALTCCLFLFQNCSRVKFTDLGNESLSSQEPLPQVISSTPLISPEVPAARAIPNLQKVIESQNITPVYDPKTEYNAVKALIIVDDSATMANSQANLANNINALFSNLESYNIDILVLTTSTQKQFTQAYSPNVEVRSDLTSQTAKAVFSGGAVFSISRDSSLKARADQIKALKTYIASIGTYGSDYESPLASLAMALDSDITGFFKKGDKALIYIITDETDSFSHQAILTNPKETINYFQATPTVVASLNVSYTFFRGFYNVPGGCSQDEIGRTTNCTSDSIGSAWGKDFTTCAKNLSSILGNGYYTLNARCKQETFDGTVPVDFSTLEQECAAFGKSIENYGVLTKCEDSNLGQSTTKSLSWQSSTVKYPLDMTVSDLSSPAAVLKKINSKMSDLFGDSYFIGVSANIKGQSCGLPNSQAYVLPTGQSEDTVFTSGLSSLPKKNFLVSSICKANENANALAQIATNFSEIMQPKYQVKISESDKLEKVVIYFTNGTSKVLVEKTDFKLEGNVFTLINLTLPRFSKIELSTSHIQVGDGS